MSRRAATRVAWLGWASALALVGGAHALRVAHGSESPAYEFWREATAIGPVFATVGALIVSRRPRAVIGWIFLASSIAGGVQFLSGQYATAALAAGGSRLAGGAVAAWTSSLMQMSVVAALLFLILLFPTGRLPSPGWRWLAWPAALTIVASIVGLALSPGPVESFPSARNPFGLEGAAPVLELIGAVGAGAGLACYVAAVASLAVRFRRARGVERLQLKWFLYAAAVGLTAIVMGDVLVPEPLADEAGTVIWTGAFLGLAVAVGVAILRHRLYDIDLLINRTLVYGVLTATLGISYVVGVVLLGQLFRPLTRGSDLAIAGSTLAVAALFRPLRARVQAAVERRFYRRRYDAARTLEGFSARLRDEVDLDALAEELEGAVNETMQPRHVSLWLRSPGAQPLK